MRLSKNHMRLIRVENLRDKLEELDRSAPFLPSVFGRDDEFREEGGLIRPALGLPQRPGCEGMDGSPLPAGSQWISSAPEPGPAQVAGADYGCSGAARSSCTLILLSSIEHSVGVREATVESPFLIEMFTVFRKQKGIPEA